MSGGSYNYLHYCDGPYLFSRLDDIGRMAETLRVLGYTDAAERTAILASIMAAATSRVEELATGNLKAIWKAVEWVESGDMLPDAIAESVELWRAAENSLTSPPPQG